MPCGEYCELDEKRCNINSTTISAAGKVMTPMDDTSSASAGAVTPSSALKLPLESAAYHDHTMEPSEAHPQPLLPEGSPRPDSEYGDFASDEEDILSQLVETVAPSFTELIAPLLVTEIEDYEGPKGLRLPKVLGAERSDSAWLSQLRAETEEQMLRDSGSTKSESAFMMTSHSFADSLTRG